jgi:hypothetical protein
MTIYIASASGLSLSRVQLLQTPLYITNIEWFEKVGCTRLETFFSNSPEA